MASRYSWPWSCLLVLLMYQIRILKAQNVCTYRVPVPDLDVCDISGGLEENINGDVYETRGNVMGMMAYQNENFQLMNQQITHIISRGEYTDGDIRDIVEELNYLKTFVYNMSNSPVVANDEGIRAAIQGLQATPTIDAIKRSFSKSIASILSKIQNLTKKVSDDIQLSSSTHASLLSRIHSNQQEQAKNEQRIQAIDQAIKQASGSNPTGSGGGGGGGGVDLTNVTNREFDVLVHLEASRTITQRGLDSVENKIDTMQASENQTWAKIHAVKADIPRLDARFIDLTQEHQNLNATMPLLEKKLRDAENALHPVKAAVQNLDQRFTSFAKSALSLAAKEAQLDRDVKAMEQKIASVQSVVNFSRQLSLSQTGDILNLKKTERENLDTLLYAFAVTNKFP